MACQFQCLYIFDNVLTIGHSGENCELATTVTEVPFTTQVTTDATTESIYISTEETTFMTTSGPCEPTNNCNGHYNCSGTEKICHEGYSGIDCHVKDIGKKTSDIDCFLGISSYAACTGRGYCFEEACCCEEPEFDNDNQCLDLNECDSTPCLNNGTCINQAGFYSCICLDGMFLYIGKFVHIVDSVHQK